MATARRWRSVVAAPTRRIAERAWPSTATCRMAARPTPRLRRRLRATRRRRRRRRPPPLTRARTRAPTFCGPMARRVRRKSVPMAALAPSRLPRRRLRVRMPRSATRAARGPTRMKSPPTGRRPTATACAGTRGRLRATWRLPATAWMQIAGRELWAACPRPVGFKNWARASADATSTTSPSTSCSSCRTPPTCRRIRRSTSCTRCACAAPSRRMMAALKWRGRSSPCPTSWARWPSWPRASRSTRPTMSSAWRPCPRRWWPPAWPRRQTCAPPCALRWPWFRGMRSWPPTRWSTWPRAIATVSRRGRWRTMCPRRPRIPTPPTSCTSTAPRRRTRTSTWSTTTRPRRR